MAKKRRWLRRTLWGLGGLLVLLLGFLLWVWLTCFAEPPELDYRPAILDAPPPAAAGGRVVYGPCWFEARPGGSLLYLEGDPYSIGYAHGRLTEDLLVAQARAFLGMVHEYLSNPLKFFGITLLVLVNNRNLPDYVPREYQLEIRGLSEAFEDPYPRYGPRYHRNLNYHAAHDISHWVYDQPVVGCTAFAARGAMTTNGHLLIGRNFDFEAVRDFDTGKLVICCRPEKGHAFLSVAWPGMSGAVTGLNEERIFCSINGAHSADRDNIGIPVSLVVRQVLQYCASIEEAVEVIESARVFVSDSYLIADGKTGEAVAVEKSPGRTEVRRIEGDLLLQANHFQCDGFSGDEGNLEYQRVGTSVARYARMQERTREHAGRLDPATAVAILRDRRGPAGKEIPLGNRATINPMIATHSVVADLTDGILWVSRGPHQLGTFEAHAIASFGEPAAPEIPADPVLADGRYERLVRARDLLGRTDEEDVHGLREVLELNPGDPQALLLLGRALERRGEEEAALDCYREALENEPPFPEDRREIEEALARSAR